MQDIGQTLNKIRPITRQSHTHGQYINFLWLFLTKRGKSEGFNSCNRPNYLKLDSDTRASPCETSQTNPISAEDRHDHQYIDNGINAESDGDSNMTLPFVNCTTEKLKDIMWDQITVDHMKSKLAAAQNKVREYQCDIYDCFDLIAATSFTVHLDQKLPEVIERERERLSLSAFLRTEDIGVHIVHISRLIITYTLE